MASGLIRVDIQNEYFPGGRMQLSGIQQKSAHAGELLTLFRKRGWPSYHVQHLAQQTDAPCSPPAHRSSRFMRACNRFRANG